jgi:hypothetical protein
MVRRPPSLRRSLIKTSYQLVAQVVGIAVAATFGGRRRLGDGRERRSLVGGTHTQRGDVAHGSQRSICLLRKYLIDK